MSKIKFTGLRNTCPVFNSRVVFARYSKKQHASISRLHRESSVHRNRWKLVDITSGSVRDVLLQRAVHGSKLRPRLCLL